MVKVFFGSTNYLDAAVTDAAGGPVTGATVVITLKDASGTALVTGASMTHTSGGKYRYTSAYNLLPTPEAKYMAEVTVTSGSFTRFAKVAVLNEVDVS